MSKIDSSKIAQVDKLILQAIQAAKKNDEELFKSTIKEIWEIKP